MDNQITLSIARHGMKRFSEVMKPNPITWGAIQQVPLTPRGLKSLVGIREKLKQNLSKAEYFLETQEPDSDERLMVMLFQESTSETLRGVVQSEKTINDYLARLAGEKDG